MWARPARELAVLDRDDRSAGDERRDRERRHEDGRRDAPGDGDRQQHQQRERREHEADDHGAGAGHEAFAVVRHGTIRPPGRSTCAHVPADSLAS